MAPLEPWQRVWIDAETYPNDLHSAINCTDCHGGQAVDDMDAAHTDMVRSPAGDAQRTCGSCHPDVTEPSMGSLHSTLAGYDTVLAERSVPENHDTLEEMEANHCNSCHTTCGDCHVSQPNSVGGGLLSGHTFLQTPPMTRTCTACHGSRVQNEYFGLNEGIPSDVHFRERMSCTACHTGDQIHGIGLTADHRYDGAQDPGCESCHADQIGVGSGIEQHEVHGTELLSCQTCHSIPYTNCVNCHVEQTNEGVPFYNVESHFMDFAIGRNPIQNAERPYRYVTLRHIPIDVDSFSFYGAELLPNFNARPTWVYSTPHNIQLDTPQNATCTACHGNDSIFLTADRVAAEELEANLSVIVDAAPPLPEGYSDITSTTAEPTTSGDGGFWGSESGSPTPVPGGDFWGSESASPTADAGFWSDAATPVPSEESNQDGSPDPFWGN